MENKKIGFLLPFSIGVLIALPIKGIIAFILGLIGIGIGSAITSATDGGKENIASQQRLDLAVPDPEFSDNGGLVLS